MDNLEDIQDLILSYIEKPLRKEFRINFLKPTDSAYTEPKSLGRFDHYHRIKFKWKVHQFRNNEYKQGFVLEVVEKILKEKHQFHRIEKENWWEENEYVGIREIRVLFSNNEYINNSYEIERLNKNGNVNFIEIGFSFMNVDFKGEVRKMKLKKLRI